MNELQKTTSTELVSADRIKKLTMQYDETYPAKPAPKSLEAIADNRDKIPTLYDIDKHRGMVTIKVDELTIEVRFVVSLVTKCITEILKNYVNVIRPMTATMAGSTAELICHRFGQMTPADVKLFMTKGVMGEYGQILDRVDGALILSWASQYWDQMKHLIKLRQKQPETTDAVKPSAEYLAMSEQLRNKITVRDNEEKVKSIRELFEERGYVLDEIVKQEEE